MLLTVATYKYLNFLIPVKDRAKKDCVRSTKCCASDSGGAFVECCLPPHTHTPCTVDDLVNMNHYSAEKEMTESTLPDNTVESTKTFLEQCDFQKGDETTNGRWHLYHTQTGRLTGFLRQRQKYKLRDELNQSHRFPWKPPYTSPVHGPQTSIIDSAPMQRFRLCGAIKSTGIGFKQRDTALDTVEVTATVSQERDDPPDNIGTDEKDEGSRRGGEGEVSRGRLLLIEGAEMRQKTTTLSER